jgi:membrane protease YdiL (CAAX protease family)
VIESLRTGADDPEGTSWRQSKWLAVAEFALIALIFLAAHEHLVPVSKTPFFLVLGWVSLRLRRLGWRDVGLAKKHRWRFGILVGLGTGLLLEAFELFVSQPLLIRLTGKQPDLSSFRSLHGNMRIALLGLLFTWTFAAFGEEMVWRGYLMNRIAALGKGTRLAWTISLMVVNIFFGLAHSYQGITGILDEGLMGVLLGCIYLGARCDLFVPIVAHGVQDTVDLVLIFMGKYPGI